MLQALIARLEVPQVTVISEVSGPSFEPQPTKTLPSTWILYGIPYDYVPQVERAPDVIQQPQQVVHLSLFVEAHTIVHIVAPPTIHARAIQHLKDHYQIYHTAESSIGDDDVRNEEIRGMKESYHILEKRM